MAIDRQRLKTKLYPIFRRILFSGAPVESEGQVVDTPYNTLISQLCDSLSTEFASVLQSEIVVSADDIRYAGGMLRQNYAVNSDGTVDDAYKLGGQLPDYYLDLQNHMGNIDIGFRDSANMDSFSRLRVSHPTTIFDAQLTYDLQPLLFEQIADGTGAIIKHVSSDRWASIEFASTPANGKAYMQTYEYFRYQPGKSQLVYITFNMEGGATGVTKFAEYGDGTDGIGYCVVSGVPQMRILSSTGRGNSTIEQSNWNLDKLDGSGASGKTLDITKTQILVIDFQALYVGRVRIGFNLGGEIVYCHEFEHANEQVSPYIRTANLPIRVGMTCSQTATTTMKYICCAVVSEGGVDNTIGYGFTAEGTASAKSSEDTHILSIQPRTTFNSKINRTKVILDSVDVIVTGSNPILFKLCIGQNLTSLDTTNINTSYSAVDSVSGDLTGNPEIVVAQGYVSATAQNRGAISKDLTTRYPFTLDSAGNARAMGRFTVLAQGIGGASNTRVVFNWKEIR